MNKETKDQIAREAEEKYPFIWPLNSKGEEMVQRVGQMPHGWGKHQKIVKAYIAGAETWAERGEVLKEALEYLVNDVRNKPNDTRYATALKKAREAIANYNNHK